MPALDLAPDLICCNAAIGACARAGAPEEARRVLREVLPAHGLQPDTKSLNGLLTAYANAQPAQWEPALAALQGMASDEGVTPDLYSCNAALAALGKVRRAPAAHVRPGPASRSRAGRPAAPSARPMTRRAPPALLLCPQAGKWERAIAFLEAMPAEYHVAPDAVSFTSAISGCERAGEWMAAAQLLRQMREAGVSPTMLTYSKLLFVHAEARQWRAAAELFEQATADGLLHNPLTLNRMLRACLDAPAESEAAAAAAALAALLPVLQAATRARDAGPMVFDRESLRMIEALMAKQGGAAAGAAEAAGGAAEAGEEVGAAEWEAAAEAMLQQADLAAETSAQASRALAKLYPLVEAREERRARKEQADAQTKADWEKTFAKGFSADALAALWLPPPEEA